MTKKSLFCVGADKPGKKGQGYLYEAREKRESESTTMVVHHQAVNLIPESSQRQINVDVPGVDAGKQGIPVIVVGGDGRDTNGDGVQRVIKTSNDEMITTVKNNMGNGVIFKKAVPFQGARDNNNTPTQQQQQQQPNPMFPENISDDLFSGLANESKVLDDSRVYMDGGDGTNTEDAVHVQRKNQHYEQKQQHNSAPSWDGWHGNGNNGGDIFGSSSNTVSPRSPFTTIDEEKMDIIVKLARVPIQA